MTSAARSVHGRTPGSGHTSRGKSDAADHRGIGRLIPSSMNRTSLRGLSKASAFFLDVLEKHPSTYLQSLAQQLSPLLTNHPRLNHFSAERDFAVASRRWKDKVKTLRIELDRVPESEREDGFENWWDRFSDIVGILEGRSEVIKKVCTELGADWKEVCAVWGIFVDTRLRRQDLP